MSRIQLLSGPAVQQALHDEPGAQLYRYQLNVPILGLALALGLIFLVGAAILFFVTGLGGYYTAGFVAMIALGLTLCSMVSFGSNFARKHFIATTDDSLLVGRNDNAWRVEWALITRQTLDFAGMTLSPTRAKLDLRTAGQHIEIPIFTPFAFLNDLESLMFEILQRVDGPGEDASDSDDAVSEVSESDGDERSLREDDAEEEPESQHSSAPRDPDAS